MLKKVLLSILAIVVILAVAVVAVFFHGDLTREELSEYINEESEFIDLPMGANVHYRDQGNPDGPAIVLVHGGYGSLHNWEFWVPALKKDYRIITMDLQAHGLTGAIPGDNYTRANMVKLVDELVTELGADSFTIGGHSMGGGVALAYALKYPEKVTSLILVGPEGIPPVGGYDVSGTFNEDIVAEQSERALEDTSLSFSEKILTKFGAPAWAVEEGLKSIFADPDKVTPEMAQEYSRILLHEGNRRANVLMFRQSIATMDWENDLVPFLDQITQPVLLMYGDKDILVPIEIAERAKSLLVNSELKVYENVGHMIQMEVTEQTAQDVLAFLQANVAGPDTTAEQGAKVYRLPTEIYEDGDYAALSADHYPTENIISGEYGISMAFLGRGEIDVVTTKVNGFKVDHAYKPFPFDEVVVVLEGQIRLRLKGETEDRVGKAGDIFWVPKGAQAGEEQFTVGESGYYRSMVFAPNAEMLASGEDMPVEGNPALAERSEKYDFFSTEVPDFPGFLAPKHPPENIISGEDEATIYQLYSGQLDIISTRVKPIKLKQGKPAPFDKGLYIIEGSLKLQFEGEDEPREYQAGEYVWVSKGANPLTKELIAGESGYYRSINFAPRFLQNGEMILPTDSSDK